MKIYRQILFLATAFVSVACTDSFFDLGQVAVCLQIKYTRQQTILM